MTYKTKRSSDSLDEIKRRELKRQKDQNIIKRFGSIEAYREAIKEGKSHNKRKDLKKYSNEHPKYKEK